MRDQAAKLRELFEQYSTSRSYLSIMAGKLGPQWKKSTVASFCKKLGLQRPKGGKAARAPGDPLASSSEVHIPCSKQASKQANVHTGRAHWHL